MSTSSLTGSEVAVVSQRPGIWCDKGPGRTEMEVGTGIWKDREDDWVRLTWAMREVDILL